MVGDKATCSAPKPRRSHGLTPAARIGIRGLEAPRLRRAAGRGRPARGGRRPCSAIRVSGVSAHPKDTPDTLTICVERCWWAVLSQWDANDRSTTTLHGDSGDRLPGPRAAPAEVLTPGRKGGRRPGSAIRVSVCESVSSPAAAGEARFPSQIQADCTTLADQFEAHSPWQAMGIDHQVREGLERANGCNVARAMPKRSQQVGRPMSWETVAVDYLLPALTRAGWGPGQGCAGPTLRLASRRGSGVPDQCPCGRRGAHATLTAGAVAVLLRLALQGKGEIDHILHPCPVPKARA